MVESCLCFAARSHVAHEDGPACFADPLHLAQRCHWLKEVVKRKPGHHTVERIGRKRQIRGWPKLPVDVCDSLLGLESPRSLEHGGNDIEASDVTGSFGKEARDDSWSAGDVEDGIAWLDGGALGHEMEERVILVAVALGKGLSLPGELVKNLGVVNFSVVSRGTHR